jgi:hypothetical protein
MRHPIGKDAKGVDVIERELIVLVEKRPLSAIGGGIGAIHCV